MTWVMGDMICPVIMNPANDYSEFILIMNIEHISVNVVPK